MSLANKKILLIDDDPEMHSIVRAILTHQGIEVQGAFTLKEALECIKVNIPHLIILDLKLSGETGFDFLEIKTKIPMLQAIPVLVCSAHGHEKLIIKAKTCGVNDFLLKPIKQTWLIQKVRKLVRNKETLRYFFDKDEEYTIDLTVKADLVRINEMMCRVRAPINLPVHAKCDGVMESLEKMGVKYSYLESRSASRFIADGLYDTDLMMVGLTESGATKIRSLQNKWSSSG